MITLSTIKHSKTIFLTLFCLASCILNAQKDTEFWFAAPEIAQNNNSNFDRPVAFRFSTYSTPAVVTVSQPANPGFPIQTINIAANSSGVVMFPPLFDNVENTPPNMVLNKGFLIKSTSPVTTYYELIGGVPNNPELFSLKGKNALGTTFYTPFQNVTDNSAAYTPLPHAAFDIVATEDNTTITITPTRPIVGHVANVPFNIILNRGQTYSAEAASQLAAQHPTGSKILSDKPIAVTVKDDLLEGAPLYGGFCRDVMGDQLVPVEKLGTRHVVHKGFLNGNEFAFIVGTANGTQVKMDGLVSGVINAGQMLNLSITDGSHFIESSEPVYVLQMTGNNCELAGEIMPALDCSGSSSVRFVRSTNELFQLFLTTRAGFEDDFILNGNANLIDPNDFEVVPGSNGAFVSAVIAYSNVDVPTGVSSIVANKNGLFQMGFLNGGLGTGCRFGFFSDFGLKIRTDSIIELCPGKFVNIDGTNYTAPATVIRNFIAVNGCDSVMTFELVPGRILTLEETIALCPGETISLGGQTYTAPDTLNLNIPGQGADCDTLATYILQLKPQLFVEENIALCPGEAFNLNGQDYFAPDNIMQTLPGTGSSCDTLVTYHLSLRSQVSTLTTIPLCPGETVQINNQGYAAPDTLHLTLEGLEGACDTLATYIMQLLPQVVLNETIEFCPGETIVLGGQSYTQPGTVLLYLPATTGCDTAATYTLKYLTPAASIVNLICPPNIVVNIAQGTGAVVVNYTDPIATSDCVCPGIAISLSAGQNSGSLFPLGNTQVCWKAADSCAQSATCCFQISIQEEEPCDVKTIGCMKYELLTITADAAKNRTYRIRVTNNCVNKLIYTAIQIPNGMTAISPAENSIYVAPGSGNEYLVRNPNFSPFYSIRFKSTGDSIAAGESDILRYKLPAQAEPTYIHIMSRLEPQISYEAHLNTFYCPIGITPPNELRLENEQFLSVRSSNGLNIFPNPTNGEIFADLSAWNNQEVQLRISDSRGQLILVRSISAGSSNQILELPQSIPDGLYCVEIQTLEGLRYTAKFIRLK